MNVIDPNNNTVVNPTNQTASEFSGEQIKAKILATVGKDTPEEVLSMILVDDEMVASAIAVLRKEKEMVLATALSDAKKKMANALNGTTTNKKPVVDDTDTRIERMTKYQQDTFSVLSPKLVFNDVDTAASWRRYLINFVIGLRNLMKVVDKTSPDGMLLASKAAYLQTYIDAADAVLEGFWKVTVDYRTQVDMRKQVEMEIFMNSEYSTYQELVADMGTTIDNFREKYTNNAGHRADEGGQTPQTNRPNGKKGKKHARQSND